MSSTNRTQQTDLLALVNDTHRADTEQYTIYDAIEDAGTDLPCHNCPAVVEVHDPGMWSGLCPDCVDPTDELVALAAEVREVHAHVVGHPAAHRLAALANRLDTQH